MTIPATLRDIPRGHMITTSGKLINLYDPDPQLIDIEDIASSLSKICRWGGNLPEFYSVAQHSCHVAWLAPVPLRFAALMHDAPETWAGDVIRPIKSLLAQAYFEIEERLKDAVCQKFNLHTDLLDAVKVYDNEVCEMEYQAFHHQKETYKDQIKHGSATWLDVLPWEPFWNHESAYIAFLNTFHCLTSPNRERIRHSPAPIPG
jgi:hypothetical protein